MFNKCNTQLTSIYHIMFQPDHCNPQETAEEYTAFHRH